MSTLFSPGEGLFLAELPLDGCRWCSDARAHHGYTWHPVAGMHPWEQPTQQQIKERMLARRAARLNAAPAVYHATTWWAPDHTGESADPYCADCKTPVCHRWARIQTRLDQQRYGLPRRTRRHRKNSDGSDGTGGWGGGEWWPF